jgi:hypothetical protein
LQLGHFTCLPAGTAAAVWITLRQCGQAKALDMMRTFHGIMAASAPGLGEAGGAKVPANRQLRGFACRIQTKKTCTDLTAFGESAYKIGQGMAIHR